MLRQAFEFLKSLIASLREPGSGYADFGRKTKTGKVRAKATEGKREKGRGIDWEIYRVGDISDSARKVYVFLSAIADKDGYCFPFYRTIARHTHLSKATVGKAIKELEQAGVLTHQQRVSRRGGSSNLYHVKRVSKTEEDHT